MKKQLLFPLALILICCCAQKPANLSKAAAVGSCPDDGDCTVELLKNQSLDVLRDNLGGTYYKLAESNTTHVVRFKYDRDHDPSLADSGYTEEIIFEISSEKPETTLSGADLQNSKILFGRFCFCRGATGYYKPHDGTLKIAKSGKGYAIDVAINITEVPQIIKKIRIQTE